MLAPQPQRCAGVCRCSPWRNLGGESIAEASLFVWLGFSALGTAQRSMKERTCRIGGPAAQEGPGRVRTLEFPEVPVVWDIVQGRLNQLPIPPLAKRHLHRVVHDLSKRTVFDEVGTHLIQPRAQHPVELTGIKRPAE